MTLPRALALFPVDPSQPVVFGVAPDPALAKFLRSLGTEVVVKRYDEGDPRREMLVGGAPPGPTVAKILPKLRRGATVEHRLIKPDGGQRVWTCDGLAVRHVLCVEDVRAEFERRRPALCVLEHRGIVVRRAMEAHLDALDRRGGAETRSGAVATLDRFAYELLPELLRINPAARFVVTSHGKGSGIEKDARARYAPYKEAVALIGRPDSARNRTTLFNLIRACYPG